MKQCEQRFQIKLKVSKMHHLLQTNKGGRVGKMTSTDWSVTFQQNASSAGA